MLVPVSVGEIMDKIAILQIKGEKISDPEKCKNVMYELEVLLPLVEKAELQTPVLQALRGQLKEVNEQLWDIEDDIRQKEAEQCFDAGFIRLARAVYRTNDRRALIKKQINLEARSMLVEEKSYAVY